MSGLIIIGSYPRLPPPPRGHWGCVVLNIRLCIIWMDIIVSRFFSFFLSIVFDFETNPDYTVIFEIRYIVIFFLSVCLLGQCTRRPVQPFCQQ